MTETLGSEIVCTKQQRIAELAKRAPQTGFTSLAHHMDMFWMHQAYARTRPDGAVGVDGQTIRDFNQGLSENLRALLEQAKSGSYRAPPVRRVRIPKGKGNETRPIGIPTFADKVLQRAVVMMLEPIYEQDFLDCSYGFRPRRSAHQAVQSLWKQLMDMGGGWVIEVDIRKFFETLDHAYLVELLRQRVRDGVLLRLIGKWLHAGVLEEGVLTRPEAGTPQGGVISPLLANIYLHYVLDVWFEQEVKPRLGGRAFLIRYADDFVIGCASEADARRIMEVLPKRFGKYGLALHPDKTQLIPFQRPAPAQSPDSREPSPGPSPGPSQQGSFDLLGFTHYWGLSRAGRWVVKRKTARDRLGRALRSIADWCRKHLHEPIAKQCQTLGQKLRGHFGYYGITGNLHALQQFRHEVIRMWHKWLSRRRRKGCLSWERFAGLLQHHPLPPAKVVHSVYRLAANPST